MRLPFDQLIALLDALTDRYEAGDLEIDDYVDDWEETLTFAGWSPADFGDELDRRWHLSSSPARPHQVPLFKA